MPSAEVELLPREARLHEPRSALDGGTDGLDVLRRLAAGAARWLAPGGAVLVETSEEQAPEGSRAFAAAGLEPRLASSNELDATAIVASAPAS